MCSLPKLHSCNIARGTTGTTFVTCRLTVAALEGADSGEIGCKIEQENIEVFKELTVFGKCSKVGASNLGYYYNTDRSV